MKQVMCKVVVMLFGLGVAGYATAAIVSSPVVTITEIIALSEYGGGDVVFEVSSATTGCAAGFWLRATDAGFRNVYAALLTAYTSGRTVRIVAHDDSVWSGSGSVYCRVHYLSPQ